MKNYSFVFFIMMLSSPVFAASCRNIGVMASVIQRAFSPGNKTAFDSAADKKCKELLKDSTADSSSISQKENGDWAGRVECKCPPGTETTEAEDKELEAEKKQCLRGHNGNRWDNVNNTCLCSQEGQQAGSAWNKKCKSCYLPGARTLCLGNIGGSSGDAGDDGGGKSKSRKERQTKSGKTNDNSGDGNDGSSIDTDDEKKFWAEFEEITRKFKAKIAELESAESQ